MYIARCRYALTSAYSDDDIDAIASHGEEEEIQEEEMEVAVEIIKITAGNGQRLLLRVVVVVVADSGHHHLLLLSRLRPG